MSHQQVNVSICTTRQDAKSLPRASDLAVVGARRRVGIGLGLVEDLDVVGVGDNRLDDVADLRLAGFVHWVFGVDSHGFLPVRLADSDLVDRIVLTFDGA